MTTPRTFSLAAAAFVALAALAPTTSRAGTENASYAGTNCVPQNTSTVRYLGSTVSNQSTTAKNWIMCPATRLDPNVSHGIGAYVWVNRSNVTTAALSCSLFIYDAKGALLRSIEGTTTATGPSEVRLYFSSQYASWGTTVNANWGETAAVACTLPPMSSLTAYHIMTFN